MKYEKIYKIEETNEKKEMYDLEVPTNHNFILANNILSHNSGKTRLLKIIASLTKGDILSSLTEAILFRTKGTLCIDEFEGIIRKGNENLRELLNTAYKKGTKVKRMIKKKSGRSKFYRSSFFISHLIGPMNRFSKDSAHRWCHRH